MGNDGSGWSMTVWPRHVDREGQDAKIVKRRKHKKRRVKRDPAKFRAALTVSVGAEEANDYIQRKKVDK